MSWIWSPDGDAAKPRPTEEMVPDPTDPNRQVSKKSANQPFLAYKEYKDRQQQLHQDWVQRKKEREEKIARGEKVGPEERDPTAEEEVGLLGLLKFIVYLLLIVALAGRFFTGSFVWEYDGKWIRLKTYWPESSGRLFSESYLATFDGTSLDHPLYIAIDGNVYDVSSNRGTYGPGGSYHTMAGVDAARSFGTGCFKTHRTHDLRGLTDAELKESSGRLFSESYLATFDGTSLDHPLYIAIDGNVYDVSSNRGTYGPGGSYHTMAGVDAARSFGTGCFKTHRTHDLRGLTGAELKSVAHWKKFFEEHKAYSKVGKVVHPPIDPQSPIPEHCNPKKAQAAHPTVVSTEDSRPKEHTRPLVNSDSKREEL
ncbi:hypothetical protein PAXINDRAFT_178625 [Paxillus involutus ATCC 200175]|nr:hypothetical protein PAXINDRAFT_178625 [Paxillus involutus ATCC 200175]